VNVLLVAEYYFANPDLVKLSNELAGRKHSVSVATSFRNFDKGESYKGVDIFEITPFAAIHRIPHSLSFPLLRIQRLVKERDVEIIHALMDYSTNTAVASFVSKVTGIPFVCNVQGVGTRTGQFVVDSLAECYDWTIERFIFRNAKKIILLSKSLNSRTRKLGVADGKVVVIPSGVDCTRFDPRRPEVMRKAAELRNDFGISQEDVVVGFVGRLVPAKGLLYLLAAIRQIKPEFPNVVVLIVGDGPQKAELQGKARDLNLRTVFTGYQIETPPYYALMDVFVLPSFFEGLPGVVLEALAMEKTVVATNVGGTSDIVVDGENGFLVPTRDAERVASALKKLIADKSLRVKMGKVGREMVQRGFLWDDIVDKVETVYEAVV
jgi:glycosyltransferase involved in cell wall biosynthesis